LSLLKIPKLENYIALGLQGFQPLKKKILIVVPEGTTHKT